AGDAEDLALLDLVVDSIHDRDRAALALDPHGQLVDLQQAHSPSPPARHEDCGWSTSRRLSPRKLKARTTEKIASPGNVPIHQNWKYCVPSTTRAHTARSQRGTRE